MMCKEKRYAMNNKGSTLIEIIVSVLIIAIVFVPLLMGMSAALKANGKSEQAINSENAAVNCLEAVKAIGKKGVETLAPTAGAGVTVTPAVALAFGTSAKIVRKTETVDSKIVEYFEVSDIKEGLETYTAKIYFSDSNYVAPTADPADPTASVTPTPLFNDYKYISFSNLSGKGTQMLKYLSDEDEARITGFRSLSGHATGTSMVKPEWTIADIVKSKQIELKISKDSEDNYSITSKSNYVLYNHQGGAFQFQNSGETYTATDESPRTVQCKYGKPETLVIYYSPIAYVKAAEDSFDHSGDKLVKNEIKIIKDTELDGLRVYVIVTGDDPENDYVKVTFDESTLGSEHVNKNSVFCSAECNSTSGQFTKLDNLYEEGAETLKIYDVRVEVENVEKKGTVIE